MREMIGLLENETVVNYISVFVNKLIPVLILSHLGQWEIVVNGRKRSYNLITTSHEDASKWHLAIQEVNIKYMGNAKCIVIEKNNVKLYFYLFSFFCLGYRQQSSSGNSL